MTDTKAWIVGSPKECGPYWVEWGCGARCATLVTPDDVWFDIDSGFEQMDHKVRRHCKITVSDPPPLPEKPTPAERDEAEGEAVRAWVQSQKPVKEKLPSGLRGLLDYYQQSEVYWAPSTPQRIFMDYCDARYDCRPEVVPPKTAPLESFLIECNTTGEKRWVYLEWEGVFYSLSSKHGNTHWHRIEGETT